jgi:hypothetical protein
MPTPFYHLSLATELLERADLPSEMRSFLQNQRAAFVYGNTAPDVQTISGQDRQVTHFFDLPILGGDTPAWERILAVYPALIQVEALPAEQTAFLAGYLCHLQADWNWVVEIFAPVFGPGVAWQRLSYRLYLHNVLRSYLDMQILPELSPQIASDLEHIDPHHWLPFVEDTHLRRWRDLLSGQLCDGCETQTVEVFAARQRISPEEYYRLLNSEEKLDREIFSRLPRPALQEYRQKLLNENILLLTNYLNKIGHG